MTIKNLKTISFALLSLLFILSASQKENLRAQIQISTPSRNLQIIQQTIPNYEVITNINSRITLPDGSKPLMVNITYGSFQQAVESCIDFENTTVVQNSDTQFACQYIIDYTFVSAPSNYRNNPLCASLTIGTTIQKQGYKNQIRPTNTQMTPLDFICFKNRAEPSIIN